MSDDLRAEPSADLAAPPADSGERYWPGLHHFRKKPVVIEAMLFAGWVVDQAAALKVGRTSIEQWCGGTLMTGADGVTLRIHTAEGTMEASIGDWIIKGIKGEFYPCKPDIFEATYEPVAAAFAAPPPAEPDRIERDAADLIPNRTRAQWRDLYFESHKDDRGGIFIDLLDAWERKGK